MKEKRIINDAQVRATSAQVEIDLEAISYYAGDLKARLEVLHKELEFADPDKDRLFEKFMYNLMQLTLQFQALDELKVITKAMQEFGLPHAAEVREIMQQQKSDAVIPAKAGIHFPSISHVEKHLTKELIHA